MKRKGCDPPVMNISCIIKVKILALIKWSYGPPSAPPIMLTIGPTMAVTFGASSPISINTHTLVFVLGDTHLTTCYLDMGVLIRKVSPNKGCLP